MSNAIHIELDAICLLILCMIVWQSMHNVNQQMRIIRFRNVVYGIMNILVLDIIWMLVEGAKFPGGIAVNYFVNAMFLGAGVLLGCMWYLYVLDTLGYHVPRKRAWIVLSPSLVFLALNIMSIWTGWFFYINEENAYVRGPLFWLQVIGSVGMLLVSFFHILYCAIRKEHGVSGTEIRKLLGFYIIPVIGTLVALPFPGMPGTWTCASVSIILIYMDAMDREVMRDSLTGLNNRKAMDNAFSEYVKIANADNQLFLFMMDLDGFKGINDRYGHPTGDQALIEAAKLLLRSVEGMRSIVVRYGGDEFLVMGFPNNNPGAYKARAEALFQDYNAASNLPFQLNISIGYTGYHEGQTLDELIGIADQYLYRRKTQRRRLL